MNLLIIAVVVLGIMLILSLLIMAGAAIGEGELEKRLALQDRDLTDLRKQISTLEQRPTVEQFEARDREIRRLRNQLAERTRRPAFNGAVIERSRGRFGA